MFKLDLEKAEQPEIKLLTSIVSQKKQEFHKNIYFCFTDCAKTLNCVITANWGKFLEMGIPNHLTCLLRNLYVDQEATIPIGHGTMNWFKIGKGAHQGCT